MFRFNSGSIKYHRSILNCKTDSRIYLPLLNLKLLLQKIQSSSIYNLQESIKNKLVIKGWIKQIEENKENKILYVTNYGCPLHHSKVIVKKKDFSPSITLESPIIAIGEKLDYDGETCLIAAEEIEVKRRIEDKFHRIIRKFNYNENYQNAHPHFRAKFSFYNLRLRLRSQLKILLHQYFHENNFIEVDTPTLTRTLRDSQHETFYIEKPFTNDYREDPATSTFGHPTYLSTSRQHHLECVVSGLNKVYSVGPCFRSRLSNGKNLFEFWSVNCEEICHTPSKEEAFRSLLESVERFLKYLLRSFPHHEASGISGGALEMRKMCLESEWKRIPYSEALSVLSENQEKIGYTVRPGMKLHRNCQTALTNWSGGSPLFVTDFPPHLKPFNVGVDQETGNALAFDLIFPHTGEIASGAVGEHDYDKLEARLKQFGGLEYMSWYMDMRKWGVAPSKGFCLGVERFLHFILQEADIKHDIPFPRSKGSCVC